MQNIEKMRSFSIEKIREDDIKKVNCLNTKKISFPHIGNYHVPVENLLKLIFTECEIMPPPPITKKTLELGSKYSPDFICVPFKYNIGNYIEALENGANVLIQAGGGCRFGYYGEVQEQILRDIGYEFEFINLFDSDNMSPFSLYKTCRNLGSRISFYRFIYSFLLTIKIVHYMDRIEKYIRENIGFEAAAGSFEKLHRKLLRELKEVPSLRKFKEIERIYNRKFSEVKVDKPENILKVGLVGELYTLMEPFSNFFLEKELAKNNIMITRFITVTYLLFEKQKTAGKILNEAGDYLKYALGADGTDSVAKSRTLAERGYDGIIHVKPFGCTPEVNAMPMIQRVSKDYKIPVLYFSFDSQTSETGVKTRLEAFYDMISMRRKGSL